jgi:tetratricopeptide (TPR) repeat protein
MFRLRIVVALALVLAAFSPACQAQLGKYVPIPAGSELDHQLTAINNAEASQKLQLLEQFAQTHPEDDYQIVADEQFVNYYLGAKQYDQAFEYGNKLFALDPDNYANAVNMVRAASEKGDTDKLYSYGEKATSILQRYKDSSPPAGIDGETWKRTKEQKLDSLKDDQDYVRQSLYSAAYNASGPAKKASYFERFAKMYPDTPEGSQALAMAAISYQQAQNRTKMLEVANGALAKDPNDIAILLILADDFSEKGEQLDKAEAYAKKAAALTESAKKPEGVSDDQWKQQLAMQKGLALSALGQVDIAKKLNAQAVEQLTKAAPLLKSNPVSYARNQYRLGFAYLNLKKNAEAKQAFTEAASVDSPYKAPSQQKITEISAAAHKKTS